MWSPSCFSVTNHFHRFSSLALLFFLILYFLSNLNGLTFLLPNIHNATAKQCGLKRTQSVMLFLFVKGRPTNVCIACILVSLQDFPRYSRFRNAARRREDLITIQQPKIDGMYTNNGFPNVFSGRQHPQQSLGDIVTAVIYVRDGPHLVPENG